MLPKKISKYSLIKKTTLLIPKKEPPWRMTLKTNQHDVYQKGKRGNPHSPVMEK